MDLFRRHLLRPDHLSGTPGKNNFNRRDNFTSRPAPPWCLYKYGGGAVDNIPLIFRANIVTICVFLVAWFKYL